MIILICWIATSVWFGGGLVVRLRFGFVLLLCNGIDCCSLLFSNIWLWSLFCFLFDCLVYLLFAMRLLFVLLCIWL